MPYQQAGQKIGILVRLNQKTWSCITGVIPAGGRGMTSGMFYHLTLLLIKIERKRDNRILSAVKIPARAEDFSSTLQP